MKRLASILVSIAILAVIYWKIDFRAIVRIFANGNPAWMSASLAMVVPLTMITAWRLRQLMPQDAHIGFGEANKLILVASVLNLILPSKMGDIAKAGFMRDRARMDGALSLSLVVFEKTCDLLSLLFWCALGLAWLRFDHARGFDAIHPPGWLSASSIANGSPLFWLVALFVAGAFCIGILLIGSRRFAMLLFKTANVASLHTFDSKLARLQQAWNEMHACFWRSKRQLLRVASISVLVWLLHLLQIWMFILALNASVPFIANLALAPLAILAGLLPLTFIGVGTRDVALVILYQPYFAAPTAAALGLLCTSRYLLPALGGAPFAADYFRRMRKPDNDSTIETA